MSVRSRDDLVDPAAVGRVPAGRRLRKARLSQQLALARSVIGDAARRTASGVVTRGLHVGVEDARFAPLAAGTRMELEVVAPDEDTAEAIRAEVPDYPVVVAPGPEYAPLPVEDETAHLSLTVGTFGGRPYPSRRALFTELFRVTRVGGEIALIETFVARPGAPERPTDPLPMSEFLELAFTASGGRLIVERLQSVRYPEETLRRGALLVMSKLGAPSRW